VATYAAAGRVDLLEQILAFAEAHEEWELDEFILLPLVWTFILVLHSIRRWYVLDKEVDKRVIAQKELAQLNEQLEDKVDKRTRKLQEAMRSLSVAHERYELAAMGSEDGLWDWDIATNEFHYSASCAHMLSHEENDIPSASGMDFWLDHVDPEDRELVRSELEQHREGGGKRSFEFRVNDPELGVYRWVECRAASALTSDGRVARIAGALRDVTVYRAVDALTGLANRCLFGQRLTRVLERSRQDGEPTFAVLFLDLDRFKDINDSLGHLAGDALLIEVSKRLQASLRRIDTVVSLASEGVIARLGGDEFAVLLEGVRTEDEAVGVAERVLQQISWPATIEGRSIRPSVSLGIAMGSPDYESPDDILRDADIAMYVAKSKGVGRVELFAPSMRQELLRNLKLETDLSAGVANREFFVEYQPQISLAEGSVTGFEALLRWQHPRFGVVGPSTFIPIAERTGAIVEIGDWVLNEVCRQTAEWIQQGILPEGVWVSTNVSAKQLEEGGYPTRVRQALRAFDMPASRLSLEITETALLRDSDATLQALQALKEIGVRLDIDDFGTGYSTFDYLCRFPFDVLKIDRRFVKNLREDSNIEVVKTLITFSKRLGLEVIAEGVETEEQLKSLQALGCETAQGFYFSPPLGNNKVHSSLENEVQERLPIEPTPVR
jgi:diguanylate cyclase (GGDEF)-like protein